MRGTAAGLVIALVGAPLRLCAQTTDVALGIEALARRDVRGAEAAFARASTGANVALRSTGYQWRAHVAWKVRGDTAAAVRYLNQALATARDSSMVLLEIARLSGARHRHREAVRTAFEAMQRSGDGERRGLIARTLVSLSLEGALAAKPAATPDSVDTGILGVVRDTMSARVARFPGRASDAIALVNAGILSGEIGAVRAGFESYFLLGDARPVRSSDDWADWTNTLADNRLFESSDLMLRLHPAGATRSKKSVDIAAYVTFLREMRAAATTYYQDVLKGVARPGDLDRAFIRLSLPLVSLLRRDLEPMPVVPALLRGEIRRRFGAILTIERIGSASELFFSHIIADSAIGSRERPAVLFILDGEVADGLNGWLLDGTGGRAGWVADDTIFMRRTAFTEAPFRAWVGLTDPQSMPGEAFRIMRDSIGDIDRARNDSLGYLPGVAARMFRDGAMAVVDSLNRVGSLSYAEQQGTFTTVVFDNLVRTSILLHELRHLADDRAGRRGSEADEEFRAKVDEVTGAPHPKLALTAILSPNIGDASSHGLANRRIMRGLARWVRMNGNAIAAYDAATPALLQLPQLTDAQLRAAFASMRRP